MMWLLDAVWHWIASTASLATLIGAGALTIAILEPKQLDAITDLRKWALVVAAAAFSYSSVYTWGYRHGLAVKQAQWDRGVAVEAVNGEAARDGAERAVRGDPPERVRNDPWNRDNWKQPGGQ